MGNVTGMCVNRETERRTCAMQEIQPNAPLHMHANEMMTTKNSALSTLQQLKMKMYLN